jgi:hypothetical protein
MGTAARAAVSNIGPGAAAAAAFPIGAEKGAAIGALVPGAGETGLSEAAGGLIGGTIAAGAAAWAAAKAQHALASTLAPETTEKFNQAEAAGEEAHPVAGAIGRLATMLPMFEFAPQNTVGGLSALYKAARGGTLTVAEKLAAKTTASQVGLQTGLGVVQPLMFGESPTKKGIAEAFVQSLLLGHPRYEIFGAPAAEAIGKEEAATDAQTEKAQGVVQNPASIYSPPPPPDLTPEQRGQLSELAARTASGAPEDVNDAQHLKLMGENENARKYYEQQKQGWAQLMAYTLAGKSKIETVGDGGQESPQAQPQKWYSSNDSVGPKQTPQGDTIHGLSLSQDPLYAGEYSKTGQVHEFDLSGAKLKPVSFDYGMTITTDKLNQIRSEGYDGVSFDGMHGPEVALVNDVAKKTGTVNALQEKFNEAIADGRPIGRVEQRLYAVKGLQLPEVYHQQEDGSWIRATEPGKPPGGDAARLEQLRAIPESQRTPEQAAEFNALVAKSGSVKDQMAAEFAKLKAAQPIVDQPVNNPPVAPGGSTPAMAEWTKHQGDPAELVQRMQNTAESGKVAVATGEGGVGRKSATMYQDLTGKPAGEAKELVRQDVAGSKEAGAQSRKLVAMLSPDKSHVLVGTASETRSGETRTLKVSTYDVGAGRKSPGGEHFASNYDKMVADGWQPLASLKTDKPAKGFFATYSPEQWKTIETELRASHQAAQRTAEAMEQHLAAGKDFGRDVTVNADETGEHPPEEAPTPEAAVEHPPERVVTAEHAEAIAEAIKGLKPEDIADQNSMALAIKKAGPDAVEAFKVMVRHAFDAGFPEDKAVSIVHEILYEHSRSGETSGPEVEKSFLQKVGQGGDENAGNNTGKPPGPDTGPGSEAAGNKPGASGTETGANPDAEGGGKGGSKPNPAGTPLGTPASIAGKTGKIFLPAKLERPHDIVDEIQGQVGKIRSQNAAKPGTEDHYATDAYKQVRKAFPNMFSDTGSTADQVVSALMRTGHFQEGATVDDLWDAMLRARGERTAHARGQLPEQKADKFQQAVSDNLAKKGSHKLSVGELSVGDTFRIKGASFEVNHIDPDTGEVQVKDGKKFGYQVIPDGADIAVDAGSLKQNPPESGGDDPFSDENVRNRTRQAKEEVENLRPGDAHTARTLDVVERNLTALGIKVRRIIDPLVDHFSTGSYKELTNGRGNAERIVTYSVADAHKPSADSLVSLYHEVLHAIFARESPEMQAAAQRAVRDVSNEELGIGKFKEQVPQNLPENVREGVQQEGRIAESLARKLVNDGFDPVTANSFMQRAVRLIRDVYNGALMALAKVAGYPISQERALAYFENRMKMVVSGDMMSWINFLGGPRMKMPDWDSPNIGGVERYRSINSVSNPRKYLDTKEGAPTGIAALNHFLTSMKAIAHEWGVSAGNLAGMTDEQVMARYINLPEKLGDQDLFTNGDTPQSLIADAVKQHGVSPDTKISDLPNDVAKQRALVVTHGMLSAVKAEMEGVAGEARTQWNKDANALERNTSQLDRLASHYVDIDYMARTARDSMLQLVKDVTGAVRGIRDVSARKGEVEQTLAQLDPASQLNGQLTAPYRKALDVIQKRLSGEVTTNFADALQTIGSMDIDWKRPSHDIANDLLAKHSENPELNHALREFLGDNPESKALLSTLIAYGKANSHMMDMLALRADRASENKIEANQILRDMVGASKGMLAELKQRINSTFGKNMRMRDRMLRISDKMDDLSDRNHDLLDSIARNKSLVDFHEDIFKPAVNGELAAVEKETGITLKNFEVVHDAEVSVPAKPDATPDQFATRTLKIRTALGKRGDLPTPSAEVIGWQRSIQKWLDNPENLKYGAKYNEMADVALKLKNHAISNEHLNIKTNFLERMLAPIQDRCRQAGTEAARLAGQGFNKFSSLVRGKREMAVQTGTNFSAQLSRAKKALGYPNVENGVFWKTIISPQLHALQDRADIWGTAKTEKEMIDRAVNAVADALKLKDPAARDAVSKLIRIHADNSTELRNHGAELGNKVKDIGGAPKSSIFRLALGVAPLVLPRATTAQAIDFYHEHMGRSWGGDKLDLPAIRDMYDKDPDQLRASLQNRFTKPVWDWFVKSLAENDKPHFSAPPENGLSPLADRENIIKAYQGAHGDPVAFAELIAALHDHKADGAFVADTLDTMQNFSNLLRTMAGDEAESVTRGSPNPPRFIVDARHWEAAPKEWWDYLMTDQNTMLRVINGQAHQAAFGRNGEAQDNLLSTAMNEQREFYTKYQAWRQEAQNVNPGIKERELQAMLKARAEKEGISFDALKNAKRNLNGLTNAAQHYDAIQSMNNSGKIPELLPWLRVLHTIAGGTVAGAGTAITAHSVFLEQPARHLGFGPRSLAMTGRAITDLAGTMANSLLQAFGHSVVYEARRTLDANDGGIYDPINTNKDRYTVAYEHAHAAYRDSSRLGQTVGTAADVGAAAMQHDVWGPGAREKALARQAAGQPVAPSLKALSPFHWIAKCLEISNFITWERHIEGMVAAGANHFESNPEHYADNDFRFTPKTLNGFNPGDREFNFLSDRLAQYGASIEQLSREAYDNRGTSKPMLSHEMRKNIQQVVLNEITLESSLTSRMPSLQTKGLGTAMNPFLGWPLQKTYQVMRGFRQPDGVASAFRNGLTPYLAILPLGMAAAWLRNKFDEDVLGRKQNVSDISQIHDVKSGLMTALDNASRVGTFGLLGEGANYFLSNDNVRPLSVDNRIFFLNTLENAFNAARGLYQQTGPQIMAGNFEGAEKTATDYQTVWRPIIQSLGGNGLLQNLGAVNHLLAIDDAEARVSNRISVNNYLRVAGRELNLDVRTFGGMMSDQSVPGPIKPFVGKMVLAAYANNSEDFNSSMRDAVRQAKTEGMTSDQAMKKVVGMYEAQSPIRIVFKSPPTEMEYRKLIAQLPDNGKQSVQQSIALFNHFGQQIGANPVTFGKDKADKPIIFDSGASSVLNRLRGQRATVGAF